MRRAIITLGLLLLFCTVVFGEDQNTMTPEQLQAIVDQLQQNQQQITQQQQLVTVQLDQETKQKMDRLEQELISLRHSMEQMQTRFSTMVSSLDVKFGDLRSGVKQDTLHTVNEELDEQTVVIDSSMRINTNPIKIGLPIIGVFFLLAASFLLVTSRIEK